MPMRDELKHSLMFQSYLLWESSFSNMVKLISFSFAKQIEYLQKVYICTLPGKTNKKKGYVEATENDYSTTANTQDDMIVELDDVPHILWL
jgi:hypothetical protein